MDNKDYFPAPIDGKFCPENPRRFTLDADFVYDDPEKGLRVVVPAGFCTDFSSVPGAFWAYFAPWEHPEVGLVHDWLYKSPSALTSTIWPLPLTRQQADDVFRRILHLKGVRITKRNILYAALRLGGSIAWDRHRKQNTPPTT